MSEGIKPASLILPYNKEEDLAESNHKTVRIKYKVTLGRKVM